MKKTLFILASVFIIVVIATIFLLFSLSNQGSQNNLSQTTPVPSPTSVIPTGNKIEISDQEVNNFYRNADRIDQQKNVYMADVSGRYQILYEEQFNQFLISILGSPFEEIRQEAQLRLLSDLGLTEEEACKLNVVITTPAFANPDFAGRRFKLSFCEQ